MSENAEGSVAPARIMWRRRPGRHGAFGSHTSDDLTSRFVKEVTKPSWRGEARSFNATQAGVDSLCQAQARQFREGAAAEASSQDPGSVAVLRLRALFANDTLPLGSFFVQLQRYLIERRVQYFHISR